MVALASSRVREAAETGANRAMVGVYAFIGSESIFFGCLIGAYLYLRVRSGVWPPTGSPHLDVAIPLINTFVLLSSGLTMHGAHVSAREGDVGGLIRGTIATIVLGAAFLLGQAYEYASAGFGLSSGLLGNTFFTLTGFHGLHVLVGLIALALITIRAVKGHYEGGGEYPSVDAGALYWHFVDGVWVILLTVLYMI